ncbi:cytochrome P450 [Dentipellis sp. KUC8613]|nr:cytochrome P450 [Dentipellis sp. KUC8613]
MVSLLASAALAGLCTFIWLWRGRRARVPAIPPPPGPTPHWLLGNLLDMPRSRPWIRFTEWKAQYGDIVYLRFLGRSFLILNSHEAVIDLLEKRGGIYAGRPRSTMAGELVGLSRATPALSYGPELRLHRKLARMALRPEVIQKYVPVQEQAARRFVQAILERPTDFMGELRLAIGGTILNITYGLSINTADDKNITLAEEALAYADRAVSPGAWLVDTFPSLKYIPDWFPFAEFKRFAKRGRELLEQLAEVPLEHVKREMSSGTSEPSLAASLLSDPGALEGESEHEFEHALKWALGSLYGGGTGTTFGTIMTFIMLMARHPDIQHRAQEEIKSVVGSERLPSLEDRASLPYVNALIKETMRFHVATPLAIARRTMQEDTYRGYHIPANTIVLPNVWSLSQDPSVYPSPDDFNPERFLHSEAGKEPMDPWDYMFGFGRRNCLGKPWAENTIFIMITSLLATVNIADITDVDGHDITLQDHFAEHLTRVPKPFKCKFQANSEAALMLIRTTTS